ncbi:MULTISPECIES: copper resistance CopC family protein [Paenarthrobacter]|uniref:Copper resistance protein CopC n=1 Tax=Paenarthrobacter ureafaciens TaxID=37931 RepID=A0AAX3EQA9_PAEUR|nr:MULTISPECIES: copper resistance CopC family protein [Paenarthrobacter]MCW3767303.1 copper resistance protein CopC [Paenarthrobacter sp. PAE-2]MDO5878079.1 copper resistance protein CopC [Paenarthrobacter sp. SD-1]UYV95388.1 copper resistance protein CopC [Paenarthrobacter ureafaciens]UYV99928.1 copper resistance protein CopC [Paenarthrobacter ureafaciens]
MISSTPGTNERLPQGPSSVALRLSAPLLKIGNEIRVIDAASTNWAQGEAVLARDTLTQPLAPNLPPGEYQVRWRVVSSDGHPVNGSYSFLVGDDAQLGSIPAPGSTQVPAGSAASPAATDPFQQVPGWIPAAGFGAVAGLGLYLAWGFVRRLRKAARESD